MSTVVSWFTTDHPRSRGVYASDELWAKVAVGSSPLARGLRRGDYRDFRDDGIIPARAGFTIRRQLGGDRLEDHPRSRGVYSSDPNPRTLSAGSSPLARGLRPVADAYDLDGRIIPARAGFTRMTGTKSCGPPDHPRSRGVYAMKGSTIRTKGRIIPARAGFTSGPPCRPRRSPDHPRSRGVYWPTAPSRPCRCGSSPLARGLRDSAQ